MINIQKRNLNLNQHSQDLRTVRIVCVVHNCRTQHSTEQFWLFSILTSETVIIAQMLSTGVEGDAKKSRFNNCIYVSQDVSTETSDSWSMPPEASSRTRPSKRSLCWSGSSIASSVASTSDRIRIVSVSSSSAKGCKPSSTSTDSPTAQRPTC